MQTGLLSKHQLARKLDVDPRTLSRALDAMELSPDFTSGNRRFFRPSRVDQVRRALHRQTFVC